MNYRFPFFLLLFSLFFILGCTSVNKHNKQIDKIISIEKINKDIDFAYKKLKHYNAKLDLYQSEIETKSRIDSLKNSILEPLKPNDFFLKFYPIFTSLRNGHTHLNPSYKLLNKKEFKKYKDSKSVFYNYSLLYQNDSIYLTKDYSKMKPIKPGSILLKVDGISVNDIIKKYKPSLYGDGFNKTYSDNYFNRSFLQFVTLELGIRDSIELTFLEEKDTIHKMAYRLFTSNKKVKYDSIKKSIPKYLQKKIKSRKKTYGYNKITKNYSKELIFPKIDSSIAILRVKDFRKGRVKKLYKEVFTDIKKHHVKNLVLDIRDNGGGYIRDAHYLYAYLVDDSKSFTGKKTVVSKTSFGNAIFNLSPIISYPVLWIAGVYSYLSTKRNSENEYELRIPFSFAKVNKDLIYHGNLYVIINGGSYSASTLLAANLHAKKRAYFVGEETGGDYNGTVAGLMPVFKLPNSKLTMTVGTVFIPPMKQRQEKGHGVYPDKEIKQTLHSKIENIDPELNWILKQIEKK